MNCLLIFLVPLRSSNTPLYPQNVTSHKVHPNSFSFHYFHFWTHSCRMSQPHFGLSVRMKLTLPKVGTWSPPGLPKTQSLIVGVKTPCIGVLYTVGKVLKCRCPTWPRMSHLDICSPSYGQKKGQESNWQFDS